MTSKQYMVIEGITVCFSIGCLFFALFGAAKIGGILAPLILVAGFFPYILLVNIFLKGYVRPRIVDAEQS